MSFGHGSAARASCASRAAANASACHPEHRYHAVPLALLNRTDAAVLADRVGQNLVVARHQRRHGPGVGLPQLRRAFDVGEEEADGAGGEPHGVTGLVVLETRP